MAALVPEWGFWEPSVKAERNARTTLRSAHVCWRRGVFIVIHPLGQIHHFTSSHDRIAEPSWRLPRANSPRVKPLSSGPSAESIARLIQPRRDIRASWLVYMASSYVDLGIYLESITLYMLVSAVLPRLTQCPCLSSKAALSPTFRARRRYAGTPFP